MARGAIEDSFPLKQKLLPTGALFLCRGGKNRTFVARFGDARPTTERHPYVNNHYTYQAKAIQALSTLLLYVAFTLTKSKASGNFKVYENRYNLF